MIKVLILSAFLASTAGCASLSHAIHLNRLDDRLMTSQSTWKLSWPEDQH